MANDVQHANFLERMLLRDYAFVEALHRSASHRTNLLFASIATSTWVTVGAFTLVVVFSFATQAALPKATITADFPHAWIVVVIAVAAFGIDAYVARIAARYRGECPEIVTQLRGPRERAKWWFTTVSILAMVALDGLLLSHWPS